MKNQQALLAKLGIQELNPMQLEAQEAIQSNPEVILLSPTGTGKTLAFLLPIIAKLDYKIEQVQALILVPSRELAIQIEQVAREMGSGFKVNAVYGGKSSSKDRFDLQKPPAILIATPGRVADHLRRNTFSIEFVKTLVLDEFDKSLEVGFEKEMKEILQALKFLNLKILTSATQKLEIPKFVEIKNAKCLNYLNKAKNQIRIGKVVCSTESKLEMLIKILSQSATGNGIVFCNFKDDIKELSSYLNKNEIGHACFYGGLEQIDRERALIKFRNGTERFLIATDLAARGIDVPGLDFIIHYQLPKHEAEFTHRNGRTARMNKDGKAYIIQGKEDRLPPYLDNIQTEVIKTNCKPINSSWETLYISGGRKDKISKGDIVGLFIKQGQLSEEELGKIELRQDSAFVAVPKHKALKLIQKLNNTKLKKKKVRIAVMG